MLTRIRTALVGLVAVLGLLAAPAAMAEIRIDITRGNMKPLPIAIPELFGAQPAESQAGRDIAHVVAADLERSGLFKPVDPRAFIQNAASLQAGPRFADWRQINAEALVSGKTEISGDGDLTIEFRLWDVFSETQMIGTRYTIAGKDIRRNPNLWRRAAHQMADAIYKRVTGEEGYFDTQLIYISEQGPKNARKKRLAIMDQDGENHRFLTSGEDLVLTPRFSPRVYILQIDTARRELLGDFPGMTFAPRFSPDGNKVVLSMSQDGNAEIYEMNLLTRQKTRLTNHPSIDTSPSYSPDSSRIVFNSDRGGAQQLYTMNADGSNVTRITFGDGRYATPVWSPRGDLIAFTKMKGGEFYIGVMRPDGSDERLLSQGYLVEGPTWAPNGRVLAYWKETPSDNAGRGGTAKLYTIDLTGFNERQVLTPLDGSDPAWSPLIP